jgi:hypothetical protein
MFGYHQRQGQIGQNYYRQVVGIPQGSVLSSLLCSIFYADLEGTCLDFTQDPMSVSSLTQLMELLNLFVTAVTPAYR